MTTTRTTWGPWLLRGCDLHRPYFDGPQTYYVDLEDCTSSARVLDVIAQVAGKTWADDATLAGLVRALDDLLRPQAHLCPSGAPRTITAARVRQLVRRQR
jgi:hypothetical protein